MSTPSGEPPEAERAEAPLVHRYQAHLAAKGIAVSRKKYRAGQVRPMFCDLWVQDWHALIEAKNSDSREALRMAIGQLYDYRRFHEPPVRLAVLLRTSPIRTGSPCCKAQASKRFGNTEQGSTTPVTAPSSNRRTISRAQADTTRHNAPLWASIRRDQTLLRSGLIVMHGVGYQSIGTLNDWAVRVC
jgi:hypothetical protein